MYPYNVQLVSLCIHGGPFVQICFFPSNNLASLQLVLLAMCSCFNTFWNLYIYTNLIGIRSSNLVSSPHQRTPLHSDAGEGKEGTVQLLIEKGADMNIKDNDGVRE